MLPVIEYELSVIDYISVFATDVKVLKGKDRTLMLKCELPEPNEVCPDILMKQKVVAFKWTASPDEYEIHRLLTNMKTRSILPCLGGARGKFKFEKLIPEQFHKSVRKEIVGDLLHKSGTLKGNNDQSIIIMPAMDYSLDNALPFFTKELRQQLLPVAFKIYKEAAEALAILKLHHGDVAPRNILLKVINGKHIRIVFSDFGSTKPLNPTNSQPENTFKPLQRRIIEAPKDRHMGNSTFCNTLNFLETSDTTPKSSPVKTKKNIQKKNSKPEKQDPIGSTKPKRSERLGLDQDETEVQSQNRSVKRRLI